MRTKSLDTTHLQWKVLPWDVLQLSSSLSGGPVNAEGVMVPLVRIFNGKFIWTPVAFRSLTAFFEEQAGLENLFTAVSKSLRGQKSNRGLLSVEFYDLTPEDREWTAYCKRLATEDSTYHYHPLATHTLEAWIAEVEAYSKQLREKLTVKGWQKAATLPLRVLVLRLQESHLRELQQPALAARFARILEQSQDLRLSPWLLLQKAASFQGPVLTALLASLDCCLYLGEENRRHCEEVLYPKRKHSKLAKAQVLWGLITCSTTERLIYCYHLQFTPEAWWVKWKKDLAEEEAAYREFLTQLSDGELPDEEEDAHEGN